MTKEPSEVELRYLVKVIGILAVMLCSLWGAETGAISALLL